MGGYADILALQGAGMVGRPDDRKHEDRIKDVWLRTIEYRMIDTLRSGGFSDQEISGILDAVMPALRSGEHLSSPSLSDRLRVNGLPPAMVNAITESIAAASAHR